MSIKLQSCIYEKMKCSWDTYLLPSFISAIATIIRFRKNININKASAKIADNIIKNTSQTPSLSSKLSLVVLLFFKIWYLSAVAYIPIIKY